MIASIDQVTNAQTQTAQQTGSSTASADPGGFAAVLGQAISANMQALASQAPITTNLQGVDSAQAASSADEHKKLNDSLALQSLNLQASIAASRGDAGTFTILAFMMNNQMREMGITGGKAEAAKTAAASKPAATVAAPARTVRKPAVTAVPSATAKASSAAQAAASNASSTSSASASLTDTILSNAATSGTAAASNAGTSASAAPASNASAASSATAASNANAANSAAAALTGGLDAPSEDLIDTLTDELDDLLSNLDGVERAQALEKLKELTTRLTNAA